VSALIENLALDIQAPRAGLIAVEAVTTSATYLDLSAVVTGTSIGPGAGQSAGAATRTPLQVTTAIPQVTPTLAEQGTPLATQTTISGPQMGFLGGYVEFFADGTDVGIIFGPTAASVSSGNAPALATTGSAGTAGVCARIPAGTYRTFFLKGDDRFVGVVGAASGNLRISTASR
jgi:hypothetical protein